MKQIRVQLVALVLAAAAVAGGLTLYASFNAWLWGIYEDSERVLFDTGTTSLQDLSPWRNDMGMAWQEDLMLSDVSGVPDQYWRLGDRVWIPRSESAFPRWGLWGVATALLGIWAICIVSPWIAYRISGSSAWNGLELKSVSRTRSRISFRSTIIMLAMMPLLFAVSWYISYDRVQSSMDWDTAQPRSFRLLFDSFGPRIREWVVIYAGVAIGLYILCWVRFQRMLRSMPHDRVIAGRVRCPIRRCQYPFDRSIQKCPECGVNWFAYHPGKEPLRRFCLGLKLGAGLACIMIVASVIWVVTDGDRRYRVWNWLTLRSERYAWQDLVIPPDRPVELRWGEHSVRLVFLLADTHPAPNLIGFLACSIDDDGLFWYAVPDRVKRGDEWLMMGWSDWPDRKLWYKNEPGARMASVPLAKTPSALRVYTHDLPQGIAEWVDQAKADLERRGEEIFTKTMAQTPTVHTIP